MFGLTTTAKLRAAEDAALQMHRENSGLRGDVRAAEAEWEKQRDRAEAFRVKYDELYAGLLQARAARDAARAELARLKASRERSNAPLAAANAKRRAEALAKADREAA